MVQNNAFKKAVQKIAAEQNITYMQALDVQKVINTPINLATLADGTQVHLTIEPDYFPYEHVDLPVYANVVLPDGTKILAMDYGHPITPTTSDGVSFAETWVGAETEMNDDGFSLMTSDQYVALMKADGVAYEFFSENMSDSHIMTIVQLHELVSKNAPEAWKGLNK